MQNDHETMLAPITDPQGRTDVANARRLAKRFGNDLRHVVEWRKFITWNGKHWEEDSAGRSIQMAKTVTDELWREARESDNREALQWAAVSASAGHVSAMVRLVADELPVSVADLDHDPWLLSCPNGTIDLRSGTLQTHDRKDFTTASCPTHYDPDASATRWMRFVDEVFCGRADLIGWVHRFCGSAITGEIRDHVVAVFHGGGGNGKSVLIESLLAVLGRSLSFKAPGDLLLTKSGTAHPTERAALFGKRLVVCSETNEGRRFDEALVKELSGGDSITARRMREDFWTFSPSHTICVTSNHRPKVAGSDNGIWRRLKLVPFDRTFPAHEQDTRLPEKLRDEASGILAWLVKGCLEWQSIGLGTCPSVEIATESYRTEQDLIGRFIIDECVVDPTAKVKASEFRDALNLWCEREGERSPETRRIGQYLTSRFEKKSSNGTWYVGLGLSA